MPLLYLSLHIPNKLLTHFTAFGQIDGYGPSLHVSRAEATALWKYPVEACDITALFTRNIRGLLRAIPWSEQDLSAESRLIQDHLLKLNEKGWWTVASQPDVAGAPSNHEIFGWGPKRGWVFQKVSMVKVVAVMIILGVVLIAWVYCE